MCRRAHAGGERERGRSARAGSRPRRDRGQQRRGQRRLAAELAQLEQEQRVAARLAAHPLAHVGGQLGGQQLQRGLAVERRRAQLGPPRRAARRVEHARRQLARPRGEHRQVGRPRRTAQQVQDDLDRGVVGPVQVVEHQRVRPLAPELVEQGAERAVQAVALGGRDGRCRLADGRQDGPELRPGRLDARRVHRRDVLVERVDQQAERDLVLVLGRPPAEHQQPGGLGARRQLGQQRALADSGLAEDRQRASLAAAHGGQRALHDVELPLASDQSHRSGA
jgi:hypothetical protein